MKCKTAANGILSWISSSTTQDFSWKWQSTRIKKGNVSAWNPDMCIKNKWGRGVSRRCRPVWDRTLSSFGAHETLMIKNPTKSKSSGNSGDKFSSCNKIPDFHFQQLQYLQINNLLRVRTTSTNCVQAKPSIHYSWFSHNERRDKFAGWQVDNLIRSWIATVSVCFRPPTEIVLLKFRYKQHWSVQYDATAHD